MSDCIECGRGTHCTFEVCDNCLTGLHEARTLNKDLRKARGCDEVIIEQLKHKIATVERTNERLKDQLAEKDSPRHFIDGIYVHPKIFEQLKQLEASFSNLEQTKNAHQDRANNLDKKIEDLRHDFSYYLCRIETGGYHSDVAEACWQDFKQWKESK